MGMYYMMYNLTQADIGQYITRDKKGLEMEVYNIYIKGEIWHIYMCVCVNIYINLYK